MWIVNCSKRDKLHYQLLEALFEMKVLYNKNLKLLARQLRNESTKSEVILWSYLKGKKMMGYDFHRQKPIDQYIADFFSNKLKLVIELDGFTHHFEEVAEKDLKKETRFSQLGITVIRFRDEQVFSDIYNVLKVIENYIVAFEDAQHGRSNHPHTPNPSF